MIGYSELVLEPDLSGGRLPTLVTQITGQFFLYPMPVAKFAAGHMPSFNKS
jgi:hypothetical protein